MCIDFPGATHRPTELRAGNDRQLDAFSVPASDICNIRDTGASSFLVIRVRGVNGVCCPCARVRGVDRNGWVLPVRRPPPRNSNLGVKLQKVTAHDPAIILRSR
jgi:hypothetical protein